MPAQFLGIVACGWPKSRGDITPVAPTYGYGTRRVHDYMSNYNFGVFWRALHAANNDFATGTAAQAWADLDQVIDTEYALGHDISYSIWGCPQWAAQVGFQSSADPYGGQGGGSPPSSQSYLAQFISRLVTRYNTDSLRNNGGAKKIKFIETWNEPTFTGYASTSYFWGSAVELAQMAQTVFNTAKGIDASIKVLGPSFATTTGISSFLNAATGDGHFGREYVDAVVVHPYALPAPGIGAFPNMISDAATYFAAVQAQAVAGGLSGSTPIYAQEQAPTPDVTGTHATYGWPLALKANYVSRVATLMAAVGFERSTWYAHDREFFGNAAKNPVIARALDRVHSEIAGRTLTQVDLMTDGSLKVTRSGAGVVFI